MGYAKSQALQVEVDKMLEKGTLELVGHPNLGYFFLLFLVWKASRAWRPIIGLLSLNGQDVFSIEVDQEEPQGHLLPGTHSSGFSTLSLDCTWRQDLPFQDCVLAFLQLPRSSPECLLWFQSGLIRKALDFCTIWMTGW